MACQSCKCGSEVTDSSSRRRCGKCAGFVKIETVTDDDVLTYFEVDKPPKHCSRHTQTRTGARKGCRCCPSSTETACSSQDTLLVGPPDVLLKVPASANSQDTSFDDKIFQVQGTKGLYKFKCDTCNQYYMLTLEPMTGTMCKKTKPTKKKKPKMKKKAPMLVKTGSGHYQPPVSNDAQMLKVKLYKGPKARNKFWTCLG